MMKKMKKKMKTKKRFIVGKTTCCNVSAEMVA